MIRIETALLAGACLLSACTGFDPPPESLTCTTQDPGGVIGTAIAYPATRSDGTAVVRIEGTAQDADGLAIHQVTVGQFPASQVDGSFNFSHWTIDLTSAMLGDTGQKIALDVTATDACSRRFGFATVDVRLAPPQAVTALSVTVTYPGNESYLPATLSLPAAVHVVASGQPAGVKVTLHADGATFLGSGTSDATLLLVRADTATAQATAYLTASTAGTLVVTAQALDVIGHAELVVDGPPVFFPAAAKLPPGSSTDVTVHSDGQLAGCEVLSPQGVSVSYLGGPVDGQVPLALPAAATATFTVDVDPNLAATESLVLDCHDAFGQAASATLSAGP